MKIYLRNSPWKLWYSAKVWMGKILADETYLHKTLYANLLKASLTHVTFFAYNECISRKSLIFKNHLPNPSSFSAVKLLCHVVFCTPDKCALCTSLKCIL